MPKKTKVIETIFVASIWSECNKIANIEARIGCKYMYVLTPRGLKARSKLTIDYMKLKMREYDELKRELRKFKN